jgi:lipoprotein-anchoring transpeptidase ErfK/SrfK
VDVGWLTRGEAISALQSQVEARLNRTIEVEAGGADLTVTPQALGSTADVAAAVDDALDVSHAYSWASRVVARLWNRPVGREVSLVYEHDEASIAAWLKQVAGERNVTPQSAAVDWVDDHLVVNRSKPGRALKPTLAAQVVLEVLEGGEQAASLPFKRLAPSVTEDTLGHTIVIRTGLNRLMLFDGLKKVKEYGVATGTPGYPTPHGHFTIVNKRMNPTWVNPAPDGWGSGLPASIGPGPGNPLGTRALDLDAPGIRIHGTYADYSIGTDASHGCIRMHIPESEELFDIVDVGTPVIIVY